MPPVQAGVLVAKGIQSRAPGQDPDCNGNSLQAAEGRCCPNKFCPQGSVCHHLVVLMLTKIFDRSVAISWVLALGE